MKWSENKKNNKERLTDDGGEREGFPKVENFEVCPARYEREIMT